jgi:cytidyltransferase-related domain
VRVLATGTFDILHPGHLLYLEEARALGDELYVIVAREKNIKHKPKPIISENQRLKMISSLKAVDEAILGSEGDIFERLYEIKPDIIALGHDQHFDERVLERELKERGIKADVVRIKKSLDCELCSSAKIYKKIVEREMLKKFKEFLIKKRRFLDKKKRSSSKDPNGVDRSIYHHVKIDFIHPILFLEYSHESHSDDLRLLI